MPRFEYFSVKTPDGSYRRAQAVGLYHVSVKTTGGTRCTAIGAGKPPPALSPATRQDAVVFLNQVNVVRNLPPGK